MSSVAAISQLPSDEALAVRRAYGGAFNAQSRILMYVAAANLLAAFLTFRRHAKPIKDNTSAPSDEVEEPDFALQPRATAVSQESAPKDSSAIEEGRK
jgi:hypothetical protein